MTNSLIDDCRKAFESWYIDPDNQRGLRRSGESYALMQAHLSWQAWKAAWEAGWDAAINRARVITRGARS